MIWTPSQEIISTHLADHFHFLPSGEKTTICGISSTMRPRGKQPRGLCKTCAKAFSASRHHPEAERFQYSHIDADGIAHAVVPRGVKTPCKGAKHRGRRAAIRVETRDGAFYVTVVRPWLILNPDPCPACAQRDGTYRPPADVAEEVLEHVRWLVRNPPAKGADPKEPTVDASVIEVMMVGRYLTAAERGDVATLRNFARGMAVFGVLCPELRRLDFDPLRIRWPLVYQALAAIPSFPHPAAASEDTTP